MVVVETAARSVAKIAEPSDVCGEVNNCVGITEQRVGDKWIFEVPVGPPNRDRATALALNRVADVCSEKPPATSDNYFHDLFLLFRTDW